MSREITPQKKVEVVKLYFQGLPYDEIAEKTDVAKGTITAIIEAVRTGEFPRLENVTDLVSEVRDLAVGLQKAGLTIAQASSLFMLSKRFIALGIDPMQLEFWVRMCRAVPEGDFTGSQVVQAAIKLTKLEQEGVTYEQAVERLESLSAKIKKIEDELGELRAEEARLQKSSDDLCRINLGLQNENSRLNKQRDSILAETKQVEKRHQDLEESYKQKQTAVDQLKARKKELVAETNQLETKARALEKKIADNTEKLRTLEILGFSRGDLEKLRARLNEMAEKHGKMDAPAMFWGYLGTYDDLVRIEAIHAQLTQEVKSLIKEKETLDGLSEKLGLPFERLAESVKVIEALQGKGVSPLTILSYQRTLTGTGLVPEQFEKFVKQFGGAEKALSARQSELKRVMRELEQKGRALEELRAELGRVKQSITILRDMAIEQIKSTVSSTIFELERLHGGLKTDLTKWGDMRGEMGQFKEELRLARYFGKLPLSDEAISQLVRDLAAPVVIQYLAIALVWCRQKSNPKLQPPKVITKKYYGINEYAKFELADILTWALSMLVEGTSSGRQ